MALIDTIFALASARGRAGVAVVRVSGPQAKAAVGMLAGAIPKDRSSGLRLLRDPVSGEALDQALVLGFGKGASFTGEDVVELHLHGSAAVISAVLKVLGRADGLRMAEPGEFTRRALENGRMDLAQVEGLGDLIEAETEAQRRQALRVMRGDLSAKASLWRADLTRAAALLEATMDFVDEDVPVNVTPEVLDLIGRSRTTLLTELSGGAAAERIRDGFEVAIIGRPNVGKSTLLNSLAGREAAITSEIEGTTRDVIEVRMDISGLPVTLLDTAGLRETSDKVEGIGVERARARAAGADLRVFLLGAGDSPADLGVDACPGDIIARAKADLAGSGAAFSVSGLTGQGVDELLDRIAGILEGRAAGASSLIRERHQAAIVSTVSCLDRAETHVLNGAEFSDLVAEELRRALRELDVLIGRVDVENILDVVFSSFCIGK